MLGEHKNTKLYMWYDSNFAKHEENLTYKQSLGAKRMGRNLSNINSSYLWISESWIKLIFFPMLLYIFKISNFEYLL